MSETIVDDDTPLTRHLQSVDMMESTVRHPTPPLLHGTQGAKVQLTPKEKLSIARITQICYRYWRGSMFHDVFSVSLPLTEETAFEERFKYILVTSPLLSDTLSAHHPNKLKHRHVAEHMTTDYVKLSTKASHAGTIGTVGTLSGLLFLLFVETWAAYQKQHQQQRYPRQPLTSIVLRLLSTPTIPVTLLFTSSLSVFFVYRHWRRSGIRQLYHACLTNLRALLEQCEAFDSKVHRALVMIQEIELVSRGYRLPMPLPQMPRMDQTDKTRRCGTLRNRLAHVLRRAFISFEEAIIDLAGSVNHKNLSRLYNMYNVNSVASLSTVDRIEGELDESTGASVEQLRRLAQLMHAKRRECTVHFMSLDLMSEGRGSIRGGHETGWYLVNATLEKMTTQIKGFVNDIIDALDTEQFTTTSVRDTALPQGVTDERQRHFVLRLSSLDQQLRTLEAKFYLCNDDIRQLGTESQEADQHGLRARLKGEYMSIQKDLNQMIAEWETGRDALMTYLEPPELVLCQSPAVATPESLQMGADLPSPIPSPSFDGDIMFDAEDYKALDLPPASRPSVYETFPTDDPIPNQQPKSRAERRAEMKAKREQQIRSKPGPADPHTMVYELKNALGKRMIALDLSPKSDASFAPKDE